jgi:hypothetical protein
MWSWIASVLAMMAGGYLLIWRVRLHNPRELCKEQEPKKENRSKSSWLLYGIALPYLGIALANSVFMIFLPLDIGLTLHTAKAVGFLGHWRSQSVSVLNNAQV